MKRKEYNGFLDKIKCGKDFSEKMEELLSAERTEQHEFADSVNEVEQAPGRIRQVIMSIAACAVVCAAVGTVYHTVRNAPDESGVESSENFYADLPFGDITAMNVRLKYGTFDNDLGNEKVVQIAEYLNTLKWEKSDYDDSALYVPDIIELYLTDGESSSHIEFRENGIVAYYYTSPNGTDSVDCYHFSTEVFSRIQGIILTGAIVGEIQSPTGEAAEMIENNFTIPDENPKAVYYANSGQFSPSVTFSFTGAEAFKEMLLTLEWEAVSASDFKYENFYVLGGILLNEEGYILTNGGTGGAYAYRAKGNVGEKIAELMKNEIQSDSLAYMEYLILKSDETYETMSADIKAYYTVERDNGSSSGYRLDTKGKLYCSKSDSIRYYIETEGEADTVSREQVSAECFYSYGNVIYAEHGENIDKLDSGRSFFIDSSGRMTSYDSFSPFYESAALDYYQLDSEIFGLVGTLRESCDGNISDYYVTGYENGLHQYYISSETRYSSRSPEWSLSVEIDENGNIIKYKKLVNGEVVCDFELNDIKFDSPDFEMPELTSEQQAYLQFDCDTFAETALYDQ